MIDQPSSKGAEYQRRYRERHPDRLKASKARYLATHKEAHAERARKYRATHPEYAERDRAHSASYYRENRERILTEAKRLYKEDPSRHKSTQQESIAGRPRPKLCEVCGEPGKITFDHSHATGEFRAWLCQGCNIALGHVKENPATLRALADYIEEWHGRLAPPRSDQS